MSGFVFQLVLVLASSLLHGYLGVTPTSPQWTPQWTLHGRHKFTLWLSHDLPLVYLMVPFKLVSGLLHDRFMFSLSLLFKSSPQVSLKIVVCFGPPYGPLIIASNTPENQLKVVSGTHYALLQVAIATP